MIFQFRHELSTESFQGRIVSSSSNPPLDSSFSQLLFPLFLQWTRSHPSSLQKTIRPVWGQWALLACTSFGCTKHHQRDHRLQIVSMCSAQKRRERILPKVPIDLILINTKNDVDRSCIQIICTDNGHSSPTETAAASRR
jgi:hypothetical protein